MSAGILAQTGTRVSYFSDRMICGIVINNSFILSKAFVVSVLVQKRSPHSNAKGSTEGSKPSPRKMTFVVIWEFPGTFLLKLNLPFCTKAAV